MAAPWAAPGGIIDAPSVVPGSGKGSGTGNTANELELATPMLKRRSNATVLITALVSSSSERNYASFLW